jgi:hypothetical protein
VGEKQNRKQKVGICGGSSIGPLHSDRKGEDLLKSKSLSDANCTGEPGENLDSGELIEAFLNSQKAVKEKDDPKKKIFI